MKRSRNLRSWSHDGNLIRGNELTFGVGQSEKNIISIFFSQTSISHESNTSFSHKIRKALSLGHIFPLKYDWTMYLRLSGAYVLTVENWKVRSEVRYSLCALCSIKISVKYSLTEVEMSFIDNEFIYYQWMNLIWFKGSVSEVNILSP